MTYVLGMDNSLTAVTSLGNQPVKISRHSFGPAIQAGFDVNLKNGWLLNFDVKKVWFDTDVTVNVNGGGWNKIDTLHVDPAVISIGIGKRF